MTYVSFWDAVRFVNWLHNGQGDGDTETGAYTLTPDAIELNTVTRNPGALAFVPSESEWYKAAYYDAASSSYFDYPTGTNDEPDCVVPAGDAGNEANCGGWVGATTPAGAYGLSESPSGTFDQGGNVWEWNDEILQGAFRGVRGGGWQVDAAIAMASWNPSLDDPTSEHGSLGFRVASPAPEPTGPLIGLAGPLALAVLRRRWPRAPARSSRARSGSSSRGRSCG